MSAGKGKRTWRNTEVWTTERSKGWRDVLGGGRGLSDRQGLKTYEDTYIFNPCLSDHPRPNLSIGHTRRHSATHGLAESSLLR